MSIATSKTSNTIRTPSRIAPSSVRLIKPMRFPVRPRRGRWLSWLERRAPRYFWSDPGIVTDPNASPEQFRSAMRAFAVGDTIKITGSRRHPAADRLLLDHVDVGIARILDVGASDGSTSVELIEQMPTFVSYTIADLYMYVSLVTDGQRQFFYSPDDGECFLVVGPRMLAWPSQSQWIRLWYRPLLRRASKKPPEEVLLVNPRASALAATDRRVDFAVHDVFTPWAGDRPDVIKVANLLRRDYFPEDRLRIGMSALLASLDEGGYLLLVNNPRIKGVPCAAGLYRRQRGRFERVAATEHLPDVDDLVQTAALPANLDR